MSESERKYHKGTDWLGLVSFGFFLILFGTIWAFTPNFTAEVEAFFKGFHLENVTSNIVFPAPKEPHPIIYTAVMQFCFIFGAFQIVILALRFVFHESLDKKAETTGGTIFWFAAGVFLSMLAKESIGWFAFIAGLVISVGLLITTSSIIKLFKKV